MTGPEPGDKIDIYPMAFGSYRHHPALTVDEPVNRIISVFDKFGGREVPWPVAMADRDSGAVDARLQAWAAPADGPANSVLYWLGHCWSDGLQVALAHSRSPAAVRVYGVSPEKLSEPIRSRQSVCDGHWAIVIIDTCWSKEFADQVTGDLDVDGWIVIGVAGGGAAELGLFPNILESCFEENFRADREIRLWQLVEELDRRLPNGRVSGRRLADKILTRKALPVAGTLAVSLGVLSELEQALERLTPNERRHFISKAQGAEDGEVSWFFEGRAAESTQVARWLKSSERGILVITGRAGTGKSALLGHVLVQSLPGVRESLIKSGLVERRPDEELPPNDVFDEVIHLTGVALADLIRRIAAATRLGIPPTGTDPDAGTANDLEWLIAGLSGQRVPWTFLIDALDEAVEPVTIARSLLRQLAAIPQIRVVLGTRPSTRESPDHPEPGERDILQALGLEDSLAGHAAVLWVASDAAAVSRYVTRRLETARAGGQLAVNGRPLPDEAIRRAAEAIRAQHQEFLFAQLAVYEMLADPTLLDQARRGTLAWMLNGGHRRLFGAAVDRLSRISDSFGPMLEALAFARGRGVPIIDGIWAVIATSLADRGTAGRDVTDADISGLLSSAQPYIALDSDGGQTVYRLAHRTFAEFFAAG